MVVKVFAYILLTLLVIYATLSLVGFIVRIVKMKKARDNQNATVFDETPVSEDTDVNTNKEV